MSLLESWTNKHCRVDWTPIDKQTERLFNERKECFNRFMNGDSLPSILDFYSRDKIEYKGIKGEPDFATMILREKKIYRDDLARAERPSVDDSVMYYDKNIRECVGITFNQKEFMNQLGS